MSGMLTERDLSPGRTRAFLMGLKVVNGRRISDPPPLWIEAVPTDGTPSPDAQCSTFVHRFSRKARVLAVCRHDSGFREVELAAGELAAVRQNTRGDYFAVGTEDRVIIRDMSGREVISTVTGSFRWLDADSLLVFHREVADEVLVVASGRALRLSSCNGGAAKPVDAIEINDSGAMLLMSGTIGAWNPYQRCVGSPA